MLRRWIAIAALLPYLLLQVQAAVACVLLDARIADPCAMQAAPAQDPSVSNDCCQLGYQPVTEVNEVTPLSPPDVAAHVALPASVLLYIVATTAETRPRDAATRSPPPTSALPPYLATLRLRI